MPHQPLANVLHYLRQRVDPDAADDVSDDQLLERFIDRRDESAFEVLVQRHGPMVLGLCRAILRDAHGADDAFQATFLVLARKAASIQKRRSAASWLYGVAYRIALRARTGAARQRQEERQALDMSPTEPSSEADRREMCELVRDELKQLPEKYRAPLVLCYLEGRTVETAARELGWPRGSMSKRLERGRDLLRERLASRGVALSAALVGTALADSAAPAAVPVSLLNSTLKAATLFAAGQAAAGVIPAPVIALAEGVLHTMTMTRLKVVSTILACVLVLTGSVGWFAYHAVAAGDTDDPGEELRSLLTLPQDPQAVVLQWDQRRNDLPRQSDAPRLLIRADGSTVVADPYGPGKTLQVKLSGQQLQEVLRYAVRENDFFGVDAKQLPIAAGRITSELHIQVDGKDRMLRTSRPAGESPAARQLAAIEQRLERLVAWVYAGGAEGLSAAVNQANEELGRQFPEAPALTAADLQAAVQRQDGRGELVLERRGVAADKNPFSFIYAKLERTVQAETRVTVRADLAKAAAGKEPQSDGKPRPFQKVTPPHVSTDKTVKYDYPIVCVRAPRETELPAGRTIRGNWGIDTSIGNVVRHGTPPGSELVLLHTDGREEVLVSVNPEEGITDPFVAFDGEWVYYAKHHHVEGDWNKVSKGADIYKVHVPTRKIVQLTHQEFTPNTGVVDPALGPRDVYNLGPCPVPGGKVVFVSDRNGFEPVDNIRRMPGATQLFMMNDDGSNVETIGHLNLGGALHPVVLADGRIMFSTAETQGLRQSAKWALWSIHPDGTNWGPLLSGLFHNFQAVHFQTQLSDGHIIIGTYYIETRTFGTYLKFPIHRGDYPAFGPANPLDPRNDHGRGKPGLMVGYDGLRMPFSPHGLDYLTRFAHHGDADPASGWGQVTHPSGAPDNHLLTAWGGCAGGGDYTISREKEREVARASHSSICLIKSGKQVDYPDQMLLIKSDPKYHYMWPRALVPYKRIYGIDEPPNLAAKKAKPSKHLPAGTPSGLVGTSSLYKRESYPYGAVPPTKTTAVFTPGHLVSASDPFQNLNGLYRGGGNWLHQGAEAGPYGNEDVHAIRIVVTEPRTDRKQGVPRGFQIKVSHGRERLRILGEFPVRRFQNGVQPIDPDGNPDTSFLAKIPADMAWTFQTLDKHGMVLNMAQTWHQLRPGEVRHDCGGCHAHSQKPTPFELTKAAQDDYSIWDLTAGKIPLLTTKRHDESRQQWDTANESGVRWEKGGVKSVEFYRDVRPILDRSCVACHSSKLSNPAGKLVLDSDELVGDDENGSPHVSATWMRLASDKHSKFGHRPLVPPSRTDHAHMVGQMSRYVRVFQSRRSLLIWKVFGKRLDGWKNEDFAYEAVPGDPTSLVYKGESVKPEDVDKLNVVNLAYLGSVMPPPEAVAGTYVGADGKKIKVEALTDEDRLTLVRWVDLGCPIDLTYDPANPQKPKGLGGFMVDDNRPTLALASPQPGANEPLTRILVGMYDYYTGLDLNSLTVTADFPIDGLPAGTNLANRFTTLPDNRWELKLSKPLANLPKGVLTVSVKDKQGNLTKIERTFSVR